MEGVLTINNSVLIWIHEAIKRQFKAMDHPYMMTLVPRHKNRNVQDVVFAYTLFLSTCSVCGLISLFQGSDVESC